MCFLVDLFFLIDLFFLSDFLHEAALNVYLTQLTVHHCGGAYLNNDTGT